jgi:hypothetical protein
MSHSPGWDRVAATSTRLPARPACGWRGKGGCWGGWDIVAWLVAIARGQNGHPYDWLLAVSGLTYVLAIAFFRWRG